MREPGSGRGEPLATRSAGYTLDKYFPLRVEDLNRLKASQSWKPREQREREARLPKRLLGRSGGSPPEIRETLRRYWDDDAPTYDLSLEHVAHTAAQRAAWAAVLRRHLPPPPARGIDIGAGTGFLSLILAKLGYLVTAVDFSPRMLEVVSAKAGRAGVEVEVVEALAETPPPGPFDAVV